MKKLSLLFIAVLVFSLATPLYAQGGCVNSPENPTAVLALVGSASAVVAVLRGRLCRK